MQRHWARQGAVPASEPAELPPARGGSTTAPHHHHPERDRASDRVGILGKAGDH
jgi:hypothetical protein